MNAEKFFIETTLNLSKLSKCVSKQVGCIIVKDGRIISTGYNGTISGICNCNQIFNKESFDREEHHKWSLKNEIHAEQNALMMAAKYGISVNGCDVYCSLQPCNTCLLLLIQSGIKNIVYVNKYDKVQYDESVVNMLESKKIILREWQEI